MIISEIFGPTFQGEGSSIGQRAVFLRLGGCNLHCSFCDTPYTWRWSSKLPHKSDKVYSPKEELKKMDNAQVIEKLMEHVGNASILVITGGEPLLQEDDLASVIAHLRLVGAYSRYEIETAGTIFPAVLVTYPSVYFNVSPKLANSNNKLTARYHPEVLRKFVSTGGALFKFVVCHKDDFEEIRAIRDDVPIPGDKIWIMPEGETLQEQMENMAWVAEAALERGYNYTPRIHTLIWGNKRGV